MIIFKIYAIVCTAYCTYKIIRLLYELNKISHDIDLQFHSENQISKQKKQSTKQ